jgi:hypothetical protein
VGPAESVVPAKDRVKPLRFVLFIINIASMQVIDGDIITNRVSLKNLKLAALGNTPVNLRGKKRKPSPERAKIREQLT